MSRQHFLRFRLPETYRQLLDIGIKNDFSMGYSDCFGFRAGTSQPYLWYDLENEAETQLTIHPFCLMDSIAFHKLKLTPAEFHHQINTYESMLKAVGGKLVIVLHNENFHRF